MVGTLGNHAHVGGHDKGLVLVADGEADVVAAVVAGLEGSDGEAAGLELEFLVNGLVIVGYAARYRRAAQQALQAARGAV